MPARVADLDWTVERAHALPEDGNRYEVLDGELFVTPAPSLRHQAAISELHPRLREYLRANSLGWAMFATADVIFSPRRLLQPDVFVVLAPPGDQPPHRVVAKALALVVEVLSPSTARADRYRKRAIYLDEGVGEYWIVDAGQRLIERWRQGDTEPEILTGELVWTPRKGILPFTMDVAEFFTEVDRYPGE